MSDIAIKFSKSKDMHYVKHTIPLNMCAQWMTNFYPYEIVTFALLYTTSNGFF